MGRGKFRRPQLAGRFGAPFVDVDERIESAAGCRIRDLFVREGEPAFREREKAALRDALSVKGCVIATGAGHSPTRRTGFSSVRTPRGLPRGRRGDDPGAGCRGSRRPLLRGETGKRSSGSCCRAGSGYRTADVTVRTDGRTVEEVAGQVADWIDRTEGNAD